MSGWERLRVWKPEGGGEKWFRGECGSATFGANFSHPDSIGIRMGTFDGDPGIRPGVRQFVAYAAAWEPLPYDGLPRFPESRPRALGGPVIKAIESKVGRGFGLGVVSGDAPRTRVADAGRGGESAAVGRREWAIEGVPQAFCKHWTSAASSPYPA